SLVATILCFSGVALFCGCGHVALTGTVTMLENHFSRITSDHATLIDPSLLYGCTTFFFLQMFTTNVYLQFFNSSSKNKYLIEIFQQIIPWNADPGKACGQNLADICNTSEFYLSYHLYIVACAGAGATVIALLIYMMATTYNYAVLKFKSHDHTHTTKF
uniref:Glycoprotein M6Ba n=1 Tax=Astyanax mexicanus TaxID=7994 RepID=A0A8B9I0V4_ASTMX